MRIQQIWWKLDPFCAHHWFSARVINTIDIMGIIDSKKIRSGTSVNANVADAKTAISSICFRRIVKGKSEGSETHLGESCHSVNYNISKTVSLAYAKHIFFEIQQSCIAISTERTWNLHFDKRAFPHQENLHSAADGVPKKTLCVTESPCRPLYKYICIYLRCI